MLTIEIAGGPATQGPLRIHAPRCVIGKDLDCEVTLAGWRVSRRHAEVFVSNDRVFVRDLDSTF
ncbi:MAG: FHA domain-containing protein, partial [Burkholderiaceae bacterium]